MMQWNLRPKIIPSFSNLVGKDFIFIENYANVLGKYFSSFSAQRLSMSNWIMSPSLPYPLGYRAGNPILECLADQAKHDQDCQQLNGLSILKAIMEDLESGKIEWPQDASMTSTQWIQKMKVNSTFYIQYVC